jgi:hypothetical protein
MFSVGQRISGNRAKLNVELTRNSGGRMDKKIATVTCLFLLLGIGLVSCSLVTRKTPVVEGEQVRVNTAAAKTIAALSTELAAGRNITLGAPSPTVTSIPPSATSLPPTATPTPVVTNTPDAVLTATAAGTEVPCNRAAFVRDVTIPDNSTILPNSAFTKKWELKNTGSCTWNNAYSVVFAGKGLSMNAPAATAIIPSGEVKPGEVVIVSVLLRAPGEPGDYDGYWMLRSGDNKTFGTGTNAGAPFYVKIHVAETFSFAEHLCSAQWSNGTSSLPCPGAEGDSAGFVLPLKDPTLENNEQPDGLGFLTVAPAIPGGYIVGKFEPVMVPHDSDFRVTIGCPPGISGCYVRFKITFRIDNGDEQLLGEWNEGYEGSVTNIIKDMDAMVGRSTAFNFYLYVSGDPGQSRGIWFNPRIVH